MSSKKELKIKPIPDTLRHRLVEVKFRVDDSDIGKNPDEVLKIEDDGMIVFISKASFHNGLIMGDKITKINRSANIKAGVTMFTRGGDFIVECNRRENISCVSADRWAHMKMGQRPGYSYFVLTAIRPSNVPSTSPMGMTIKAVKNRALLTNIEPNSLTSLFFAMGDAIIDFDGATIPFGDTQFIREEIGKFQKNGKISVVVERPITAATTQELRKYLLSIMPAESDFEMASDVKAIGLEASNMHAMIFKKLKPPSILTADVRRASKMKKNTVTEGEDKNIKISTASTEMRINSDVEDEDELKDVVKKSHAASGGSAYFDDE